ncbi:Ger(x)C family spore germination protein [Brevibacillus sp. TJ4]|uniref:Ger(x)C family spore germination protein n=1 Tax=Brevibacillus sp. TJ4 TaxID=3234853 RepID=UPI0037D55146
MGKQWKLLLCLLILATSLLSGCWDNRELEERNAVLGIALDLVEIDGEEQYKMTVQIPIPIKIAGSSGEGGGGNENAVKIVSGIGRTVMEASRSLQLRLNQQLFVGHTRILAVSEKLARRGLSDIMDSFRRDPMIRRLMWTVVVKGRAATLLEIRPQLSQIPVIFQMEQIENGIRMGTIPDQSLGEYFNDSASKVAQPFLNYVEASQNELKWRGVAVFREDRMVGTLTPVETWTLMRLRNKRRGGMEVVPIPGTENEFITFRPKFMETKITFQKNDNAPGDTNITATFHCEVKGDLLESTGQKGGLTHSREITELEGIIKQEMERRAHEVVGKVQKEFNSDVLRLGLKLRAQHYHDYWKHHDWNEDFKDFPIRIVYTIKLQRLGMAM